MPMPNQKRHAPARTANGSATADQPPAPTEAAAPASETASTEQSQPQQQPQGAQAPQAAPPPGQQQRRDGLRITDLKDMSIQKLTQIAKDLSVGGATGMRKQELIFQILKAQTEQSGFIFSE